MGTLQVLPLALVMVLISSARGQCPSSALTLLTDVPTGLTHNVADGVSTNDGDSVSFTCTANNTYLSPDPNSDGIFGVVCSGSTFTQPTTWPGCEVRCAVPESPDTYKALPTSPAPDTVPVNGNYTYTCNDTTYVEGTESTKHTVVCGADGTFDLTAVPACVVKCPVPEPETGYNNQSENTPMASEGGKLNFYCTGANAYVNGSETNKHSITCGSDGQFPTGWPACVNKCSIPDPAEGYNALSPLTPKVLVNNTLTFTCTAIGALVDGTTSDSHTITCGEDGTFPSDAWPSCIVRCLIPDPEPGYAANAGTNGTTGVIDVGGTAVFSCATAGHTVGNTLQPDHTITCQGNGAFPPGWPTCAMRCPMPAVQDGYTPIANGTALASSGESLNVYCDTEGALVNGTSLNYHQITCGDSGAFSNVTWPACIVRCLVPDPEPGYAFNTAVGPLDVGTDLTFICSNSFHTVGETLNREHVVKCGGNGKFPSQWPLCETRCPHPVVHADYNPVSSSLPPVIAGQSLSVSCKTPGALVDGTQSTIYSITCQNDGTYPVLPAAWPNCTVKCRIPSPPSGYNAYIDTTPVNVGDTITFNCSTPGETVGDTNSNQHDVTCGGDGNFPPDWPSCDVKCPIPSPPSGYLAHNSSTPVAVNTKIKFYCEIAGETVGDSLMDYYEITCGSSGSFPGGWPNCARRCPLPANRPGYRNKPSGTPPMAVDQVLVFECKSSLHYNSPELVREVNVTCLSDGSISPTDWPKCETYCPIPIAEEGYNNITGVNTPKEGDKLEFACTEAGAKVGTTISNIYTVECQSDGSFPSGWPTCEVKCVPPIGEDGYNSQTAGTTPVPVGQSLLYNCMEENALAGDSIYRYHNVTCGADGEFPSGWPNCSVKCLIPEPASGYAGHADYPGSVDIGTELTFTCTETGAESGGSMGNTHTILCDSSGSFPLIWPTCAVPVECPTPPTPTNTSNLVLEIGTSIPVKAHRTINYACSPDTTHTTDEGKIISMLCLGNGKYPPRDTWPTCRPPVPCTATPPVPPADTLLKESNATLTTEGDEAVYTCMNDTFKVNGLDEFKLTCGKDGGLGEIVWPKCTDPNIVFTQDVVTACECLGDLPTATAKTLLDTFCRDPNLSGTPQGSVFVPSRKRCGTTKISDIQNSNNICFCDSPQAQSEKSVWFKLVLKTEPWQWTFDMSNVSYLLDATSHKFLKLKRSIEASVDDLMFDGSIASYVKSNVYKFSPGQEAPTGLYASVKPVTLPPENDIECPASLLMDFTIPPNLARSGSGSVGAGKTADFKCTGAATNVLFTKAGADGRIYDDSNMVSLTCNADGTAFNGAPETWPTDCRDMPTDTCAVPSPVANGMAALTDTSVNIGTALTFTCSDPTHKVTGTNGNTHTVTCNAMSSASDPWYQVKFPDLATWPSCAAPPARKKRAADSGYNFIEVDIEVQVNDPTVTAADIQVILDAAGDSTSGDIGNGVIIDNNCDPAICTTNDGPGYCSNKFFELMPLGFKALSPFGYYQSPANPALVDAGNLLRTGQLAELRCQSTAPLQWPLFDDHDHNSEDRKLTITCMAPEPLGKFSHPDPLPKCVSICTQRLPAAEFESDLEISKVIPINNVSHPVDWKEYNKSTSWMFAGDRIMYKCRNPTWGINGGIDTVHDEFGCDDTGRLNTPRGIDFDEPWPKCMPQQQMVVTAVELMLDRYDRRISDRYKLIDFRERDNEREIVNLNNYWIEVTLPVALGLSLVIAIICMCSRVGSPMCSICRSKV